jgi:hypothetical protein
MNERSTEAPAATNKGLTVASKPYLLNGWTYCNTEAPTTLRTVARRRIQNLEDHDGKHKREQPITVATGRCGADADTISDSTEPDNGHPGREDQPARRETYNDSSAKCTHTRCPNPSANNLTACRNYTTPEAPPPRPRKI